MAREAAAASVAAAARAAAASVKTMERKHQQEHLRLRSILAAARSPTGKALESGEPERLREVVHTARLQASEACASAEQRVAESRSNSSQQGAHDNFEEWAFVGEDLDHRAGTEAIGFHDREEEGEEEWALVDAPDAVDRRECAM
mmetsp:Transcript_21411/g.49073  ORF Transcript_21411/g.49073 Transcript_21411/m.49073 type:complete len:145 (+) Transcript_21411:148-582(+)